MKGTEGRSSVACEAALGKVGEGVAEGELKPWRANAKPHGGGCAVGPRGRVSQANSSTGPACLSQGMT